MIAKRAFAPPPAVSDNPVRAVAAIDLPGVTPAPLEGLAEPMFDRLVPRDLLVDAIYQRGLSARSLRLIRSIVGGWDWMKYEPPVVALTDRGFELIDGQHTAIAAACHPEIATMPVMVVDGSGLARRASAFVSHAVDRLQATPAQIHHAALVSAPGAKPTRRKCTSGYTLA